MDRNYERKIALRMTGIILAALIAGSSLSSCATESGESANTSVIPTAQAGRLLKNNFASSEFSSLRTLLLGASNIINPVENTASTITKADDGTIYLLGGEVYTTPQDGVSISGSVITITKGGEYTFKGTLDDGKIIVATPNESDEVTINLSGVTVTSSASSPFEAQSGKVELVLTDGTRNVFKDSENSSAKACMSFEEDLTISGTGTLSVYGSTKNGISCDADVKIKGGCTVYINAVDTGLKGDNSVTVKNTYLTIISAGDGIKTDSADKSDKGFVSIENGETKINSSSDGIQADHSVIITGGSLSIVSDGDGVKVDNGEVTIDGGIIDIQSAKDGIQAGNSSEDAEQAEAAEQADETNYSGVTINAGSINIVSGTGSANAKQSQNTGFGGMGGNRGNMGTVSTATEDTASTKGIKASDYITISGGEIVIDSYDDAIHSNDKVTVTGGKLTISSGDDAIHGDSLLTLGEKDTDGPTIDVLKSYEGFEAFEVYVNSGNFSIISSDDGINAAGGSDSMQNGFGGGMGQDMGQMPQNGNTTVPSQNGNMTPPSQNGNTTAQNQNGEMPGGGTRPTRGQKPDSNGTTTDNDRVSGGKVTSNGDNFSGGSRGGFGSADNGYLEINGGYIFIKAGGDGVDSNGTLVVNGGTVIVDGPSNGGNGALDYNSSFTLNGGEIIAMGSSQWARETIPSTANQSYVSANVNVGAESASALYDSDGKLMYAFQSSNSYSFIMITSPDIVSGKVYTLKTGVTVSGESKDGVYDASSCTVSGGTTVTVTAK